MSCAWNNSSRRKAIRKGEKVALEQFTWKKRPSNENTSCAVKYFICWKAIREREKIALELFQVDFFPSGVSFLQMKCFTAPQIPFGGRFSTRWIIPGAPWICLSRIVFHRHVLFQGDFFPFADRFSSDGMFHSTTNSFGQSFFYTWIVHRVEKRSPNHLMEFVAPWNISSLKNDPQMNIFDHVKTLCKMQTIIKSRFQEWVFFYVCTETF